MGRLLIGLMHMLDNNVFVERRTKSLRAITSIFIIGASSLLFVACGCNDIPCQPLLTINVDGGVIPDSGTVQIIADEELLVCNADAARCNVRFEQGDFIYRIDFKPKAIELRVLDAESVVDRTFDVKPAYTDRSNLDACGDCGGRSAYVAVP